MLYLAEVQKPKASFTLSSRTKAELRLLACQRSEQSWSAIPGEELIAAPDDANNFNSGVLVLIDMNANRQIQSPIRDAGKHLVGILQNLSRQIEKDKKEIDEIESWRQSLSLQSQQLQLRQEEIYAREEDLEHTRAELDRLTQEAQSLEASIADHERSRQKLVAQWEQLQAKEQHLDSLQQAMSGSVSEQQIAEIRAAFHQLGDAVGAFDPQQLELTVEAIEKQQELLNGHWDEFHQHQKQVLDTQAELDRQQQAIDLGKQRLQELDIILKATQTDYEVQQYTLTVRQEYVQLITTQIGLEQDNYQQIYRMSQGDTDIGDIQINLEQLQSMPIAQLQTTVENLQTEVDRAVHFVHLEEEELKEKQEAIDELRQAIVVANEFDRFKLEADLADEQDGYNMLDHTLDGQRQTIRERQAYLQIHNRVLRQRQGNQAKTADGSQIEWESILQILAKQRQQQESELDRVKAGIQNMLTNIEQTKVNVGQQSTTYLYETKQMKDLEDQHQTTTQLTAELVTKIAVYEKIIQPLQDRLNAFKHELASLADAIDSRPKDDRVMQQIESLLNNLMPMNS